MELGDISNFNKGKLIRFCVIVILLLRESNKGF